MGISVNFRWTPYGGVHAPYQYGTAPSAYEAVLRAVLVWYGTEYGTGRGRGRVSGKYIS